MITISLHQHVFFLSPVVFDATPKIPYGILTGNLLEAGNYDECLRANVIDVQGEILGKFCRNSLAVVLPIHLTIENQEAITTEVGTDWLKKYI